MDKTYEHNDSFVRITPIEYAGLHQNKHGQ